MNVVAAALLGAPLTAGVAIASGYLAGSSAPVLVALGLVSFAAVVGSAVIATGIGSVFPRFEAVRFDASRKAVPPSKRAFSLFSTYLSLVVIAVAFATDEIARAVGSALLSQWLPWGIDISTDSLLALSWVVLILGAASIPLAYRIAVQRIETFRV